MSFSWSYSRASLHQKCPLQYAHKHLWKTPPGALYVDDPEFFLKGRRVHGGIAAYLTGAPWYSDQDKITYTEDMRFEAKKIGEFQGMLDEIKSNLPSVEQQWGYDAAYKPTSWFGDKTYWRVIVDAGVLWPDNKYTVIDWKTGRPSADNSEQMKQFAVGVFQRYPQVHWLETRLEYVDTGQESHEEFTRSQVPAMIADFEKMVGPIKNDTTFTPRPGSHCRYCPQAKSKGGGCAFG